MRQAPTAMTASVPMVGIASMAGSKTPRLRPTLMLASRSSCVTAVNRSASWSSRPRLLTTRAASKLSCATSETSARICWTRVTFGDMARWNSRFTTRSIGKTVSPIAARNGSTSTIWTAAKTSMTTTPNAIGSGWKTFHVDSTSEFALDSSWPDGCRWCQASGRRRYWRVTRRR